MLQSVSFVDFPLDNGFFYCAGVLLISSTLPDSEKLDLISRYLNWNWKD
jgi:hypothetical protein